LEHGILLASLCASSGKISNKQISFVQSNIYVTQQGLGLQNEQSLVNFGGGHNVLVTSCITGVDVE